MKRDYMKPAMRVYKLQLKCHILVGSNIDTIDGEELDYIGGGSGPGQ